MRENYVNRYAVALGPGGLGGTAYEIHATAPDLLLLAERLRDRVEQYQNGTHAFVEKAKARESSFASLMRCRYCRNM